MWITFLKGPLNFNPLWLKVLLKILCKIDYMLFGNYWVINKQLMPNKPKCQKNSFLSHFFCVCTIVWMTYHSILSLLQMLTWDMKYITYMFDEMKTNELSKKKLMKVVMWGMQCYHSKDEYACKKYFITKWWRW